MQLDPLVAYMTAADEPTATEKGAALAAALRRKSELGLLGTLSGGRLAAPGAALSDSAAGDQNAFMHATVARTAAADRKSAQAIAQLQHIAEQKWKMDEAARDNDRAERQINAQLELARSGQAIAGAGLGLRAHEVSAADAQRLKAEQDKKEAEVRELAQRTGESPALIAQKGDRVEEALGKFKPGELPGFGRATSFLPDSLVSDEGRNIRSDAREMVNTLLFIQSGAGVSNAERENKYNAYGLGKGASESAFRDGFAKLRADLARALQAKQAGFTADTRATYQQRGGVGPEDVAPKTPQKKKFKLEGGKLVEVK